MQMFTISSRQSHYVHKCNTIGLSSLCIATVFVPKVESGEQADVPKFELGEQRINLKVKKGGFAGYSRQLICNDRSW